MLLLLYPASPPYPRVFGFTYSANGYALQPFRSRSKRREDTRGSSTSAAPSLTFEAGRLTLSSGHGLRMPSLLCSS
ncbi:hypothetical protein BAUCODRAFT_475807 [Baudoinia panamericana UAMH 10762]|uniref:Uncharacterized protein n=1 Tax=Baudoinia panamericana (strain UAMH 10762) TaxID=717646 RepID=M2MY19_BAUPA|nr:uncharacterized protein BAUCODRAFT_475807 [Baudoinia panamericana UAMH 10762]EMC96463.1 hypothetical protein BAUCODRAFT_475807 [Baudoinia panamericana UAMH 10762]